MQGALQLKGGLLALQGRASRAAGPSRHAKLTVGA